VAKDAHAARVAADLAPNEELPKRKHSGKKLPPSSRVKRKHAPKVSTGERKSEAPQRPSNRKPEVVEVSSPKLYVGNLSFDATESDLNELFNGVGKVNNAEIVSHKYHTEIERFRLCDHEHHRRGQTGRH